VPKTLLQKRFGHFGEEDRRMAWHHEDSEEIEAAISGAVEGLDGIERDGSNHRRVRKKAANQNRGGSFRRLSVPDLQGMVSTFGN